MSVNDKLIAMLGGIISDLAEGRVMATDVSTMMECNYHTVYHHTLGSHFAERIRVGRASYTKNITLRLETTL